MSSKAVDDTARMLGASVLIAVSGGSATAVLWASGYANPAVVACVFGAPAALVLAIGRLAKRVKEATPDVHHHHYTGHVDQRTVHTKTAGLWARTNNQQ
jgi:membrane protein implicated in regulation of membrane protease activity